MIFNDFLNVIKLGLVLFFDIVKFLFIFLWEVDILIFVHKDIKLNVKKFVSGEKRSEEKTVFFCNDKNGVIKNKGVIAFFYF